MKGLKDIYLKQNNNETAQKEAFFSCLAAAATTKTISTSTKLNQAKKNSN